MTDESVSCSRSPSSVSSSESTERPGAVEPTHEGEVPKMTARVGQKAPDFSASAYYKGGFTNVKLSDFAGKWVMLCFYPGDFTFV